VRNGSTILPATQTPEKVAAQALYRDVRRSLEPILSGIRRDIRGAIRSLGDPDLIRYELRWRIKRFGSVERKGRERAKPVSEILAKAEDLIGFRAVCRNLQDVQRAAKVIAAALRLKHLDVRVHDYVSRPKFDGYRAVHLVVKVPLGPNAPVPQIGCEIQIRSLLQNA
jgi:ppGpp synthetase/RelA/SpoT-type nucleotidyltranferase